MAAPDESELARFFSETATGFALAADKLGTSAHDFRVAGRQVCVRFAGRNLTHLARPLAHLSCQGERPGVADLEILAWDSFAGWLPPRPPWDFGQLGHGGAIAGLPRGRFEVNYSADHGLLSLFDRKARRALYWIPAARDLPYWETAAPFRIALHWWSQSFGGQIVHAAAVGRDDEGVLLAGRGGSGKSTTAVACIDAGMQYVGDDYVLLTCQPTPVAHSLYHSAKIHTAFLRSALPQWQSRVAAEIGPERKSLLFIDDCAPRQIRQRLAIRALLQPKVVVAQRSSLAPLPRSLGLLAIAPSTMYQLPAARESTLAFLAEALSEIPALRLNLGSNLSSAPAELQSLLGQKELRHAA